MIAQLSLGLGLALTVFNIIDRIALWRQKAELPHQEHEQRISQCEEEIKDLKRLVANDNKRIKNLEEGSRVIVKSIGALLSHGIDGNNVNEMQVAREEVNDYLGSLISR